MTPPRRWPFALTLLTLAGGLLRFAWLGRPPLWGDEALVYWRTCGTYADLLRCLRADGFPPLHYELYWLIARLAGRTPGPALMRLVPAICGTLLVPAVYALARQLLPRRPALLAAAFTASSAFALFYSRDAKMYAEAWLAMTVAAAAVLAWLRTGRWSMWLAWVAAAAAAAGLRAETLAVTLGLVPLVLLTQRRAHWRQAVLAVAGAVLIGVGPGVYYAAFNSWGGEGIAWVALYNRGRTGPDLVGYLATTFLTGWEWPRADQWAHLPTGRATVLTAIAVLVVLTVSAGLLPWPKRWRGADAEAPPVQPWQSVLWLGAWIGLPAYGFYCHSIRGFAPPMESLRLWAHPIVWAGFGGAMVVLGLVVRPTRRWTVRTLPMVAVLAALVVAGQAIAVAMAAASQRADAAGHPWVSTWVPRYLGFVWPAVAVAVGGLLHRLPTVARWPAVGLLVTANLGLFAFRLVGSTEPPVDRMAADVWAAANAGGRVLVWADLPYFPDWQTGPGEGSLFGDCGRYELQRLADRRPMSPAAFKATVAAFAIRHGDAADRLPAAVRRGGPALRQVIVWSADPPYPAPTDAGDDVAPALAGWHRTADDWVTVRDVWTARDVGRYRRRVYARADAIPPGQVAARTGG